MLQKEIEKVLDVLKRGGTILYPTDTVWGIGCDATNGAAVDHIYAIKQRNETRSMLVLVDGFDMLAQYVEDIPDIALQLNKEAAKPVSIIYPGAKNLAVNLVAEDASIGIRIVRDTFCVQLIKAFGKPVVSTSANISGESAPGIFDEIPDEIRKAVDYTVSWRQDDRQRATASSIIKVHVDGTYSVLRS